MNENDTVEQSRCRERTDEEDAELRRARARLAEREEAARQARPVYLKVLEQLASENGYDGGPDSTCYRCPFATEPLDRDGRVADWADIYNDPTEAYFRCGLPGRDNEEVFWGEYSPCTVREWTSAALVDLKARDLGGS